MKNSLVVLSIFASICLSVSCKKEKPQPAVPSTRTIKFVLYTNEDFSNDNDTISFLLTIRNNSGMTNSRIVFDSTLTTIRIKDIPGPSNKLVFSKTLPNDQSVLTAGFVYTTRFGIGTLLDTCGVNERLKVIEYPFQ